MLEKNRKQALDELRVVMAIQAIDSFCQKHKLKLEQSIMTMLIIRMREGRGLEWVPCEEGIHKIILRPKPQEKLVATHPNMGANPFMVLGDGGFSEPLTNELNEVVCRLAGGFWEF